MKKIYLLLPGFILSSILLNAQGPTTVTVSADCNFIRNFDASDEGFSSPSIYSSDDNVSFFWNAGSGALVETSGLINRTGSLISPVFLNTMSGQSVVGFTYAAPAGTEYRIRVISGLIGTPLEILATTANGPQWTALPSTSGNLCLLLQDVDLTVGQGLRYEFSFRATQAQDILFDNFAINSTNSPLPVTFMGFVARKNDNGTTRLLWNVGDEINVKNYAVERSLNGTDFTSIGAVDATGKSTYSLEDNQPMTETRYYRVRNIDIDGSSKYTPVVRVLGKERTGAQIQLYPVPARDQVYVQHNKAPAKVNITIYSLDGRMIKQVQAIPNTYQTSLNISDLKTGMYLVKYDDGNGDIQSAKLIRIKKDFKNQGQSFARLAFCFV
ncbi:MAG: T9SS type A sorting domain-containing protein [Bacteroidota bacterium]